MSILSSLLRAQLSTSVGNGHASNHDDIRKTRQRFAHLGRYKGDTDLAYMDRDLDRAIRRFQRDKGLREDGVMNPGGETERALLRDISHMESPDARPVSLPRLSLAGPVGNNRVNNKSDVQQVQRGLGALGLAPETKLYEPSGILDRETVDGISRFQRKQDLRIDGFLNPRGETETALNINLRRLAEGRDDDGDEEDPEETPGETPQDPPEEGEGDDTPPPPPPEENPDDDEPKEDDPKEDPEKPDCSELESALVEAEAVLESANQNLYDIEEQLKPVEEKINIQNQQLQEKESELFWKNADLKGLELLISKQEKEARDKAAHEAGIATGIGLGALGTLTGSPAFGVLTGLSGYLEGRGLGSNFEGLKDSLTTSELEKEANELKKQIAALEAEVIKLKNELETLKSNTQELQNQKAEATAKVDEAESKVNEARTAAEACQTK